jgi:hypothetical protein
VNGLYAANCAVYRREYSSIHRDHDVGRPYHYVTLPACLDQARSRWKISVHLSTQLAALMTSPSDRVRALR